MLGVLQSLWRQKPISSCTGQFDSLLLTQTEGNSEVSLLQATYLVYHRLYLSCCCSSSGLLAAGLV